MQFDDRLITVLQNHAAGERSARTQYRQLLDILGRRTQSLEPELERAAYERLAELDGRIDASDRAAIVHAIAPSIRNTALIEVLAAGDPRIAAAALGNARAAPEVWTSLIPDLPVRARGFLRHRGDLPADAVAALDALGIHDRALPVPDASDREDPVREEPEPVATEPRGTGIAALVERIEAFKKRRDGTADRPAKSASIERIDRFDFRMDGQGRIDWAADDVAPMVIGLTLQDVTPRVGGDAGRLIEQQLPLRGAQFDIAGAAAIAGSWQIDAVPRFDNRSGRFLHYSGHARRVPDPDHRDGFRADADRIRQLLHELRTPVTAIQGFAELIQQQMFGATPHEYRALAAAIAGDSAHMLAGFDEIDRLARLESGSLELEPGEVDFAGILRTQLEQLSTVLASRVAKLELRRTEPAPVAINHKDAQLLAWRLLATLSSTMGAGEQRHIEWGIEECDAVFRFPLTEALAGREDVFAADMRLSSGSVSASLFGAGFALRLARAEAAAVGGGLRAEDDHLELTLPAAVKLTEASLPEPQIPRTARK